MPSKNEKKDGEESLFDNRQVGSFAGHQDMKETREPLAFRMRPRTLDEFVGQDHIIGPGKLLRRAIQRDQLSSIILAGPPGTGKTTLARIIANTTKSSFIALNAVLSGVSDLRAAIEQARKDYETHSRKTILFVDEVHRWNKSQQDALLPWVENGMIILIGATTENPFFEVNRALVSRSRVFLLRELDEEDLSLIAQHALQDKERGYGNYEVLFAQGALEHLIRTADGDARSLLNALELAVETSVPKWPPETGTRIEVSMEAAEESIQRRAVLYDKDGDYHYDTISAFIKSLRGSDPDAAFYWLARMIYAGEDPSFIFRRMLISASEDIGLADPNAIQVVTACAQAFDRVGMPEGQYHLSEAALYLATCPKSNSAIGYFDALKAVEAEYAEVPDHLRDANRDGAALGHGENYKYPHAYKDHWVAQQYLPETLRNNAFYFPGSLGFEGTRRTDVLARRESQLALLRSDLEDTPEQKTLGAAVWSKEGENRQKWLSRAEGAASRRLQLARAAFFEFVRLQRNDVALVFDPRKGFYTLEAVRQASDGTVCCYLDDQSARAQLEQLVGTLPELSRPIIWVPQAPQVSIPAGMQSLGQLEKVFGFSSFDKVLLCEVFSAYDQGQTFWQYLQGALREIHNSANRPALQKKEVKTEICLLEIESEKSSQLSRMIRQNRHFADTDNEARLCDQLEAFEIEWGGGPTLDRTRQKLNADKILSRFQVLLAGCDIKSVPHIEEKQIVYARTLEREEVEFWFSDRYEYGLAMQQSLGQETKEQLKRVLLSLSGTVQWPLITVLASARVSS